jgi:hypothetical protein
MTRVRAFLAMLFSVAIIIGFFMGKIESDVFLPVGVLAISWWFSDPHEDLSLLGKKSENKPKDTPKT